MSQHNKLKIVKIGMVSMVTALSVYAILTTKPGQAEAIPVTVAMAEPQQLPISRFYRHPEKLTVSKKDFDCLARNIYYEAGIEPHAGKIAVAHVTWNRVKTGRWGDTICKVVYAKNQFSWTRQTKAAPKGELWKESLQAAQDFIKGLRMAGLNHSKFYHATWINPPAWTEPMQFNTVIGQHVFYTYIR